MPNKKPSMKSQWETAASEAENAIQTLLDLQAEYQDKLDNLPENLANGAYAEKLQTVCDLDLQSAMDTISDAVGADLPLGFGRD